jgi:hypothetical protein
VKNPARRITRLLARNRPAAASAHPSPAPDPADALLGLITAAVAARQAHLLGETAELPDDPGIFGWDTRQGEALRPGGLCIGIAASGSGSGRRVYLFPVAAYAAAERAAASRGIPVPVTCVEASAVLSARRLIITDPAAPVLPACRRIRNVAGRVRDMPADLILTPAAPAAGTAPSTPPPGGKGR